MCLNTPLTRRHLLKTAYTTIISNILLSAISRHSKAAAPSAGVLAGAIRWDAWYQRSDASINAQDSLSSPRYYERAPFFCAVNNSAIVECIGTAESMDNEIKAAVRGGLTYWAFDWYAEDSSLRTGWKLYRASPNHDLINWCGIVSPANLGSTPFSNNTWQSKLKEWATYMREPSYQKVNIQGLSRPLLYLLWDQSQLGTFFDGKTHNVLISLDYLAALLAQSSIARPYVVLLHGIEGAPLALAIRADAISNYIAGFSHEREGPYRDLDTQTQAYWRQLSETGCPIVPIAMVGWDTRPRQERPVPWEHRHPNLSPTIYYEPPTPSEFASHVRAALQFIKDNPSACSSKLLLIYSWNECDEGGGLIPTHGDPSGAYLNAIGPILSGS